MSQPLLEVTDLAKHFPTSGGVVHAVDGVSFTIDEGEVMGLVGESGSGKSTVGRTIMRLLDPTSGTIRLAGTDITTLSRSEMRPLRRQVHMVFQDPYSSLNPRMTSGEIVGEALRLHKLATRRELDRRVSDLFERCGLRADMRHRYPHELSGGQRQRVGLARALSVEPSLLIADEPISALDVSVQASIINLLMDLQKDMGFSCLFITHDLSAVEFISNRIAVMYLGKIVELADREDLFTSPKMPYTQALLSAALVPNPGRQRSRERVVLSGDLPSPIDPPSGCHFHTRCPLAEQQCIDEIPVLSDVSNADDRSPRVASCHLIDANGNPPDATGAHAKRSA